MKAEETIMPTPVNPLDFYAAQAIKTYFPLMLAQEWTWDGFESFDDMLGRHSALMAQQMLVYRYKHEATQGITQLDYIACAAMEAYLKEAVENNYSFDGFSSWEDMVASNAFSMALATVPHLN